MNRALFLDRDGVINEDHGYVHKIDDFCFRDGIFEVCRAAQNSRLLLVVITNQAGIGRGFYSTSEFKTLTKYMVSAFRDRSILISGVYHCPYHPTHGVGHFRKDSYDRKPNPGMLLAACRNFNINPGLSLMIGDNETDRSAAFSIGIKSYVDAASPGWINKALEALRHLA